MPKGICLFSTVNRAKNCSNKPLAIWKNDSLMWLKSCEKETLGSHTRELEKRRSIFLFLIKPTLDSTWRTLFGCVLQIWGWKHNTNRLSWFVRLRFLCLFGGYLRTKIRYLREDIFSPKVPTAHSFHRHLSRQRLISDSATTTATFLMQTNWNGHFPHASICICARIRYHNCCLLLPFGLSFHLAEGVFF